VVVLLDTTPMTPVERSRSQAMAQFLDTQEIPMRFDFERPPEQLESVAAVWKLGHLHVLESRGSAMRGIRGPARLAALRALWLRCASWLPVS
jgi:hypothetical protein